MRTYVNRSNMTISGLKNSLSIPTVHKKSIYVIIFLENESLFATASDDSEICIYQTKTGKLVRQFTGHTD